MSVLRLVAVCVLSVSGAVLGVQHAHGFIAAAAALAIALTGARDPKRLNLWTIAIAGCAMSLLIWMNGIQTLQLLAALLARISSEETVYDDAATWSDMTW
jgi:hypothetical protein